MQALKRAAIVAAPLRVQALTSLRRAIIDGELAPGQRLREAELSEATGVSRSVIREALRQLDAEGLIVTVPNKGAVVRTLSPAEAEDIYRIRALIEGYAASLFVEHASDEDMEKLVSVGQAVIEAYAVGGVKSILKAKDRFYAILYAGGGSEVLRLLYEVLNARISLWRARGLSGQAESGAGVEQGIRDIREIVAAVTRRDAAEAERRVRQRVMTSAADVLQTFAKAGEDTNAGKGMTTKRGSSRGVSATTSRSPALAGARSVMPAADRE
jgi:DNA-binding GntR family transcriptional regulator